MDAEEIIQNIKDGKTVPLYLLQGEEPFFIDLLSDYMQEKMLSEGEKAFNQRVFYGKDTNYKDIVDEVSQYPMMSEKRLVILREAQEMKSFMELESYFERPVSSSILVMCYKYKKIDQRTRGAKFIKQNGIIFESKRLYEKQLPEWINKEAKRKGLQLKPEACQLMTEYLGTDLGSIVQNLEKIKLSKTDEEPVTALDIETIVGIHKDYNVFELQKALGYRDRAKIIQIVFYICANPKSNPMVMVLASLYSYFSKLYIAKAGDPKNDKDLMDALGLKSPYFLNEYKDALKLYTLTQLEKTMLLLREYDLKTKGVNDRGSAEGDLLKELTLRILG